MLNILKYSLLGSFKVLRTQITDLGKTLTAVISRSCNKFTVIVVKIVLFKDDLIRISTHSSLPCKCEQLNLPPRFVFDLLKLCFSLGAGQLQRALLLSVGEWRKIRLKTA